MSRVQHGGRLRHPQTITFNGRPHRDLAAPLDRVSGPHEKAGAVTQREAHCPVSFELCADVVRVACELGYVRLAWWPGGKR